MTITYFELLLLFLKHFFFQLVFIELKNEMKGMCFIDVFPCDKMKIFFKHSELLKLKQELIRIH